MGSSTYTQSDFQVLSIQLLSPVSIFTQPCIAGKLQIFQGRVNYVSRENVMNIAFTFPFNTFYGEH